MNLDTVEKINKRLLGNFEDVERYQDGMLKKLQENNCIMALVKEHNVELK